VLVATGGGGLSMVADRVLHGMRGIALRASWHVSIDVAALRARVPEGLFCNFISLFYPFCKSVM
jgi:hypothetical protein